MLGRVRAATAAGLVAVAVLLLALVSGCGQGADVLDRTSSAAAASTDALAPASPTTDLGTVLVADLPAEAVDTLELIAAGGPFAYSKDGAAFQNREGILPARPPGFYQEYTVETPGSDDRGVRRIVTGDDGSRFYTDDHYASFREVLSGGGA